MEGYSDGLATGMALRDSNGNNNNGWGNGGWEFLWIILLFALWGGNGWGNGNNGGAGMQGYLTRSDLCQDMNFNNLENAVRGISQGICDSTYALNNTITSGNAALQSTLCQGFYGVQSGLQAQGYESRLATQGLSAQLAQCCCAVQGDIKDVACQSASNTAAIIQSGNMNTQRILDYLCNEKIDALRTENLQLTNQLSQQAQTRTLIDTLLPVARPAYITCSPYASAFGYPYGYANSGCGCNTGCGCGSSL